MHKLTLALVLLYANQAMAWQHISCILPVNKNKLKHWAVKQYSPVIDPVSIAKDSAQYAAVLAAIAQMNANPSQFRYRMAGFDHDGVGINNGESEIWMQDLGDNLMGVSAIERSDADFSPTCTATESDIIINSRYRPQREPVGVSKIIHSNDKHQLFEYGGSYSPLQSIVMHELAHSAGLQHEGEVMNLMGGDYLLIANGDRVTPYIGQDSAAGLIALHGLSPTAKEEVSVSHWRYGEKIAGSGDSFFSVHHRTRLFDMNNVELPKVCAYQKPDVQGALMSDCPEPIYQVTQGQKIKLELSYENAGKTRTVSVKADYYLSTDNHIDNRDRLLKSETLKLNRERAPRTSTIPLTIPNTLTSNTAYWLGCLLDGDNKLAESIEDNNASYVGIQLR